MINLVRCGRSATIMYKACEAANVTNDWLSKFGVLMHLINSSSYDDCDRPLRKIHVCVQFLVSDFYLSITGFLVS